ncbi:MAG TPA: hypothetical protein PLI45_03375 [Candidatus Woesebacteria bacterium]|nr:hypothetical protein [Candidatus Woesebacteria bacterium]
MLVENVYAAVNISEEYAPASALGGEKATLSTLINPIITNVLIISGLAALVVILFAGFAFISAGGDKAKTAQASQMLTYGIIGLVVVVGAFLLTRLMGSIFGFNFI